MLLTDISSAPSVKMLKKCQCKQSARIQSNVFSIREKFNFDKINTDSFRIHINMDKSIIVPESQFNNHFNILD